ncbi:MAG: ATP synthase F1 subunit gamma [Lachnospiraceae bacterium]|nr:ATP synthase F1 subunit gamma [Lachnospiraceae bacterium]
MASMKQIKKRKRTVESTGKITKAMKLVATVKLQKTKQIATDAVPFFDAMYEKITGIIKKSTVVTHKYLKGKPGGKKGIIVFSSNKGLAGGYNASIVRKLIGEEASIKFDKNDTLVYAVGTKVRDELKNKGFTIELDFSEGMEDIKYGPYILLARKVLDDFVEGKINEIYLVYTYFKNTITHIPRVLKLLPFDTVEKNTDDDTELLGKKTFTVAKSKYDEESSMPMNYEMDEEEVLNKMIPQYISTLLYGALTASIASENGARMTAMDSATKNAKELSDKLGIMYNRARQGAITQELTEIVAGANAI